MITTVDFLRHGEVSGGSYYRGITDDPLTESGWQQMQNTVANRSWDHIVSSPLQRCRAFAETLQQQSDTPFTVIPAWQEINFGAWEGKTADQIDPQAIYQFYQDPINFPPPQAENFVDFIHRLDQAWHQLTTLHQGKHILVVTHGGVIRSLFHVLLSIPVNNTFNIQIDHAGVTRFQCFHENSTDYVTLIFHNLVPANIYLSP